MSAQLGGFEPQCRDNPGRVPNADIGFFTSSSNNCGTECQQSALPCAAESGPVESTRSPPHSSPGSGEWARPRSDRVTILHALLWCDLLSFHNFLHDLWHRDVHNLCLLEHELRKIDDPVNDAHWKARLWNKLITSIISS